MPEPDLPHFVFHRLELQVRLPLNGRQPRAVLWSRVKDLPIEERDRICHRKVRLLGNRRRSK